MTNVPRCRNCQWNLEPEQRHCPKCGATQWGECDYCGKKLASDLGTTSEHEMNCERNPENHPSGSLLEV